MIDERMKEALERTKKTLCRHLEDLNDQVDQDGGRIKDHMVLDGLKDCVKALKDIKKIMSMDKPSDSGKQPAVSVSAAK